MDDYKEKLKSLGFRTESKPKTVRYKYREDNGKLAGQEVEHWDGRQDATANLPVTTIKGEM